MHSLVIRIIVLVICVLNAISGRAQIQNYPISEEISLDRLYLGLLSDTHIDSRKLSQSGNLTLQAGARVKWTLTENLLTIRSFGVVKVIGGDKVKSFTNFEAILSPLSKVDIHLGVMATPTTELRPNPTTWQSQVETNAESTLPGGRPGIKVRYKLGEHSELVTGVHLQQEVAAYHLKLGLKNVAVSGFVSAHDSRWAVKWKNHKNDLVASFGDDTLAISSIVHLSGSFHLFTDVATDTGEEKTIFRTWGVRKYFSGNHHLQGFFSLTYNHVENQVGVGFFLHI